MKHAARKCVSLLLALALIAAAAPGFFVRAQSSPRHTIGIHELEAFMVGSPQLARGMPAGFMVRGVELPINVNALRFHRINARRNAVATNRYALDGRFTELVASFAVADDMYAAQVSFLADDGSGWRQIGEFTATSGSPITNINIPLDGVRTLFITITFLGTSAVGQVSTHAILFDVALGSPDASVLPPVQPPTAAPGHPLDFVAMERYIIGTAGLARGIPAGFFVRGAVLPINTNALRFQRTNVRPNASATNAYALDGRFERFEASFAVADDMRAAQVSFWADDGDNKWREIGQFAVGAGSLPLDISIPLVGVQTLNLSIAFFAPSSIGHASTHAVLYDAQFFGQGGGGGIQTPPGVPGGPPPPGVPGGPPNVTPPKEVPPGTPAPPPGGFPPPGPPTPPPVLPPNWGHVNPDPPPPIILLPPAPPGGGGGIPIQPPEPGVNPPDGGANRPFERPDN